MLGAEALEVLKQVYQIAMIIKKHVETVQANQSQCKRLNERIQIIVSATKGLEQQEETEHFLKGLMLLKSCLERSVNFVNKFTASSKWYKYLIKTDSYTIEFQKLTVALKEASELLKLGLSAQQIFNREKDKEDQRQDFTYIKDNQMEIIRLNQKEIQLLQKLDMNQNAQQIVLKQQFESLKEQLNQLSINPSNIQPKPPIDAHLVIPFYALLIDKQIIKGNFATIYQGRWEYCDVAIKMLEGHFTEHEQTRFVREVDIMSRLRHRNIVPLYGACLEKSRACLVMPYYPNQDLRQFLQIQTISLLKQKQIALDIAKGLQYLHNKKILHRNLKSSTILLDNQGLALLTNFGLCKIESQSIKTMEFKHQELYWLAPEFFQRSNNYNEQSEIFSYGVILWEILTGKHPKEGYQATSQENLNDQTFITTLTSKKTLPIPNTLPVVFQKLLKSCWAEPGQRPNLAYIIEQIEAYHPEQVLSPEDCYEQGLNFEEQGNFIQAFKHYQTASDQGYFKAHNNYATFFLQGKHGISQNKVKAAELFEKAAKLGHVRAMVNLAIMKEYGEEEVTMDIPEALFWYQKAAELGDAKAQKKVPHVMQKLKNLITEPEYQNNLTSFQHK